LTGNLFLFINLLPYLHVLLIQYIDNIAFSITISFNTLSTTKISFVIHRLSGRRWNIFLKPWHYANDFRQ